VGRIAGLALLIGLGVAAGSGPIEAKNLHEGIYLGFSGMAVYPTDSDVQDHDANAYKGTLESSLGFGLSVYGGYKFRSGLRTEGEIALRKTNLAKLKDGGFGLNQTTDLTGSILSISAMGNVYYDLQTGTPFQPYIGAGVGLSRVGLDISSPTSVSDSAYQFAYQGMFGVLYGFNDRTFLKLGYRYFATLNPTIGVTEFQYHTHNLELGIMYLFGS
jgi:opacity protein-like surface antigen